MGNPFDIQLDPQASIQRGPQDPNDPSGIYKSLGMTPPPGFVPLYSPNQINSIPIDMSGIDAYRQMATRQGPSTWASLAKINQAAQDANQKETAQKTASGQTAAMENALASSGGLSSGARERAQESGTTNALDMSQNIDRQGNLNDLQIGLNDEQNRVQQLGALPSLENTALQPLYTKANMQNQENQALNSYNMNAWQQQNQAIAANAQANATRASGKK